MGINDAQIILDFHKNKSWARLCVSTEVQEQAEINKRVNMTMPTVWKKKIEIYFILLNFN